MLAGMGLYAEVGLFSPGPEPFATKACYVDQQQHTIKREDSL